METATLANGCFWCSEAVFTRLKGVKSVMPGYSGGRVENPTYEQVSSGRTGHAEAAKQHGAVLLEQKAQRRALRADQIKQREVRAASLDDDRQGRMTFWEGQFGGGQRANDRVFVARLRKS